LNSKNKIQRSKAVFLPLLLLSSLFIKSQELVYSNTNIGFNVGANLAFGTHFQRFGLNLNFFYVNRFFQANTDLRTYFSFKNLGPRKVYPELVLSQGVVVAYGGKQKYFNPFLGPVSNQTGYSNSAGYSYNAYFNKIKTTQQTGIIGLQFGSFSLLLENDILARPLLDRFRTGAFLLQYQYKDLYQAGINCTMWTGAMGRTIRGDSCFPYFGYIDTTGAQYAKYSHGLLSAQFKYNIGLSQNVQANLGVDAQQVRNAMQNRLIHDMFFIPKSWFKRYNCHIPMLDENDEQYLYKKDQKIKKPRPYWNIYSNASAFY
jgi:hypothetical protein